MPTTLDSWYEWAFKPDWQYRQEQAESCLLHPSSHIGSKFGKLSESSSEKGKELIMMMQELKAQPLAMEVTLPSQGSTHHMCQMQWMLIQLGDIPQSNVLIVESCGIL